MVNRSPSPREIRILSLVLLVGFGMVGLLLWRAGRSPTTGWSWAGTGHQVTALALWAAGLMLATTCLASQHAGRRIYGTWMTVGAAMGVVMTTLLLTGLFFLFLPFFEFIRLSDPLRRRRGAASYWEPHRANEPTLERLARPF